MRLYGAFSQFEFLGDGFVRTPQSQVPRHLALTPCQAARGLFRQARLADAGFQAIGWLIAIANVQAVATTNTYRLPENQTDGVQHDIRR